MTETIMQESVDALLAAGAEAKDAIREAHGILKDLRHEIASARQLKAQLVKDIINEIVPLGSSLMGQFEQLTEQAALKLTESIPLSILCAGCGQMLAVLYQEGLPLKCGACGHRFMVRDKKAGA